MKFKIKIKPKISYYVSILVSSVILFYFAYKGVVAYLIHRELYGGGLDTLVILRASISGIMLLLIFLFIQFIKIPDLKSHRTILEETSKNPEVKIDWRIYTKNPERPLIRDLIVEGLSLARTQKEEFKSIILNNDNDINYLFKALEEFIIK